MMCVATLTTYWILLISVSHMECSFRITGNSKPKSPVEVAKTFGYRAESHDVSTADGYILTMHRILSPNINLSRVSPEPFILQHGLFCNSGQWIVLEPKQNLAFLLADVGFDVWLTNIRGNMFSRRHKSLSPTSATFWDYSWHEHGTTDMPAMVDYVLNFTGLKQTWYCGHSMGTTMFFVMSSMRPEYNNKIKHMFALAPVAYMSHLRGGVRQAAKQGRILEKTMRSLFNNHLETDFILLQFAKYQVCSGVIAEMCGEVANSATGYNPRSNASYLHIARDYLPDYASVGQLAHYSQLMLKDFTFRMFDYYEMNEKRYNATEPPEYPVEKTTAPMTFFYAKNDLLAAIEDVEKFSSNFKNIKVYLVPDPNFNHIDFIFSSYAVELVYKPMLEIIAEIQRNN